MKRIELESRIYSVVRSVTESTIRPEDTLLELKRGWPTPPGADACQLAAHLNASMGQPALWIFGVDENTSATTGVDAALMDSCIAGFRAKMDGVLATEMTGVVDIDGKPVVGILWRSDSVPYVAKLSAVHERDVPWRDGTTTRSAHREELVSILAPLASRLDLEVLSGACTPGLFADPYAGGEGTSRYALDINLYLNADVDCREVAPDHNASGAFRSQHGEAEVVHVRFRPKTHAPFIGERLGLGPDRRELECLLSEGPGALIVRGPGSLRVTATLVASRSTLVAESGALLPFEIALGLGIVNRSAPLTARVRFVPGPPLPPHDTLWWMAERDRVRPEGPAAPPSTST